MGEQEVCDEAFEDEGLLNVFLSEVGICRLEG